MADVTYPCYWEKKDQSGGWYWIYYAANGEPIARSSESYVRRVDCEHSISLVKGSSAHKVFYTE
ncbi:YegP family protein [Variovorax sp. RB2P76]|uniref:YegP family protein n=1 Tax=Variovorax sp. RB2P76 TaxID=3443736 RepID=UPI003F4468A7